MSELVLAVRLDANSGGLVGEIRTAKGEVVAFGQAVVSTGEQAQALASGSNTAATAARELGSAAGQAAAAAGGLSSEMRQAATSIGATGTAAIDASEGVRQLATGAGAAGASAEELAGDLRQAGAAAEAMAEDTRQAANAVNAAGNAQRGFGQVANDNEKALRNQQFATRNAGQQVVDFGTQLGGGADPARAFSQQIGQMGYAMSEMGGVAGKVGAFMVGPWGVAATLAAIVLAPVIENLLDTNKALENTIEDLAKAAKAADVYGNAQSLLGKVIDLTNGKLKTQNQLLLISIQLQARANIMKARQDLKDQGDSASLGAYSDSEIGAVVGDFQSDATLNARNPAGAKLRTVVNNFTQLANSDATTPAQLNANIKIVSGLVDSLGEKAGLSTGKILALQTALVKLGTARGDILANQEVLDVLNGGKVPDDLKPYKAPGKPKKPPKPKSTDARDEFGRDAADKIASITESFTDTPAAVKQTDNAIRQLNDLIDDLGRKKPPNFEGLIKQAEQAKTVVRDGLQRPFNDMIDSQRQQLDLGALILAGHEDQADALRTVLGLEKQIGPLLPEQKDAILAGVQALKAQQRELDILRQKQQVYLNALGDVRNLISDTIYQGFDSIKDVPAKLLDTFKKFEAQFLTEKLFGNTFRQLQDQVTGTKVVEEASYRFRDAADTAADALRRVAAAANDNAAGGAGGADNIGGGFFDSLSGNLKDLDGTLNQQGSFFDSLSDNLKQLSGSIDNVASAVNGDQSGDIVVTGRRSNSLQNPSVFFGDALGKLAKGVGISDAAASTIGKVAGKGLQGAMEGQLASGVAQMLGIKQSQTGAAIGGALGSFLPIPGGSFIGGLIGGTLGQLFVPKAKPGGVTVSNVDGSAARSGTSGSDAKLIAQSSGLGDAVASGLNDIVNQLGGKLGDFSVSIGKYKDDLRVNENGRPLGGVTGSQAVGFGDDENAAVSYAISRAIAQGAVSGLSEAVTKALKSSTDVQKALQEALKVQNLETLIGGVTAQIDKIFKDYEAQAADRVDLAKKYGLDLLKVEQVNAEQRADLLDSTLKQRVGSLQNVLDSLKFGDLFEGTASDRRQALLDQITVAQSDAEAGKDGAADKLADLYNQLVQTSKEAFGTAGPEYTTDRAAAETGIDKVIKIEQDRINAAAAQAQATTDAVNANNNLTNEGNGLLAVGNGKLDTIIGLLGGGGGAGSGASFADSGIDLGLVARNKMSGAF